MPYRQLISAALVAFAVLTTGFASDTASEEKKAEDQQAATPQAAEPSISEQSTSEQSTSEQSSSDQNAADQNADSQAETLAGHSYHGEVFNEGPRQAAYLVGGTGRCSFPVNTESEQVQQLINQGVGQLHGFWYLEAERTFREVESIEPDCAIAYWGMAMANINNKDRAKKFIEEAHQRKQHADVRGKQYIDALQKYLTASGEKKKRAEAYVNALETIALDHPEDTEALAFTALQLWQNRSNGSPIVSYLAVDALIERVLQREPLHPVHHYRIHLWDYKKPAKALQSAAKCGMAAPAIAHMWHMPGHIYSRLKRYADAAWQQEASARVDHAHMMRDGLLPDQIHNFAHNNEWLIRNLIKVGRVNDAIDLAKNMIDLPRHPKYNTPNKRGSAYYGRLRLFEVLNEAELWEQLIELAETRYLEPTDQLKEQVKRLRYVGRASFRSGLYDAGVVVMNQLQNKLCEQTQARSEAVEKAGQEAKANDKSDKDRKQAEEKAGKKFDNDIKLIERAIAEMEAHVAVHEKKYDVALQRLKDSSGVGKSFESAVLLMAGKEDEAIKKIDGVVQSKPAETIPLASQVYTLWKCWKRDEAKDAFDKLRDTSSDLDIEAPPFARLASAAEQFGMPADWRIQRPPAGDLGERPPLDELGPFRWSPSTAPEWTLQNAVDSPVSLSDYRGKPVVVIFYLGYGCLHCAEQLQAFAPQTQTFRQAGISIVAISTDDRVGLQKSIENYGKPMPFPILANADLNVFKDYRVFDDFEKQPLHGTFLIDKNGQIRWHDISYEPFMDHEFVLNEAKRLLGESKSLQVADAAK